jgi:glutamyl-tRNA reductase
VAWTRGQGAKTVVHELVERFERVRAEEVRRNLKHFHPEERAYIDRMTKTLINRLLRPPITQLTSGTLTPSVESARLELVRELFALEPSAPRSKVHGGAA